MDRTDYTTLDRIEARADWRAIAARLQHEARLLDMQSYVARNGRAPVTGDSQLIDAYISTIEV